MKKFILTTALVSVMATGAHAGQHFPAAGHSGPSCYTESLPNGSWFFDCSPRVTNRALTGPFTSEAAADTAARNYITDNQVRFPANNTPTGREITVAAPGELESARRDFNGDGDQLDVVDLQHVYQEVHNGNNGTRRGGFLRTELVRVVTDNSPDPADTSALTLD